MQDASEYTTAMRGGIVVVTDRFYASSQTCSACKDALEALSLATGEWACRPVA